MMNSRLFFGGLSLAAVLVLVKPSVGQGAEEGLEVSVGKRSVRYPGDLACPAMRCMVHCPHGNLRDARGCLTCRCNPAPINIPPPRNCGAVCMIYCRYGNVKDSRGCDTCSCKPAPRYKRALSLRKLPWFGRCGPTCMIHCPSGRIMDSRGCPTCRCKPGFPRLSPIGKPTTRKPPVFPPTKCGPVCLIYCQYGNVKDSKGCPTCRCNTGPPRLSPIRELTTKKPPVVKPPVIIKPPRFCTCVVRCCKSHTEKKRDVSHMINTPLVRHKRCCGCHPCGANLPFKGGANLPFKGGANLPFKG